MLQMLLLIFSTGFYFVFFRYILVTGLHYLPSDMSYRSLYAKEVTKAGSTNVLSPSNNQTTNVGKAEKFTNNANRMSLTAINHLFPTLTNLQEETLKISML